DAIGLLVQNPSDSAKAQFNKWFGAKGAMADDVLNRLGKAPPAPPVPPAPATPQQGSYLGDLYVPQEVETPNVLEQLGTKGRVDPTGAPQEVGTSNRPFEEGNKDLNLVERGFLHSLNAAES